MKKIIERLLIFLIGVPAFYALVFFLPFHNHLAFNVIVIIFSAIGAVEFSAMLEKKQIHISKVTAAILGALLPLLGFLPAIIDIQKFIPVLLMAAALLVLLSQALCRNAKLETVTNRLAGYFSVTVYPGLFMYWIPKISSMNIDSGRVAWETSGAVFLFLVIVFGNDSVAWLTGSLLGKNNRGIIPASPNKSIAGFIGGLLGSIIICAAAFKLFPFIFPSNTLASSCSGGSSVIYSVGNSSLLPAVILGLCTGLAATLGDLSESAIKRSCDVKDSGNIMLGRGGILDSIDSIAPAAPVYYFLFNFLYL